MGNRIRSMTERMNDENARLRADLARVTAERDDYRERWEQTGCTRHYAMETAIKLQESCQQQLEAVIQERDRYRAAIESALNEQHHMATRVVEVCALLRAALKVGLDTAEGEG